MKPLQLPAGWTIKKLKSKTNFTKPMSRHTLYALIVASFAYLILFWTITVEMASYTQNPPIPLKTAKELQISTIGGASKTSKIDKILLSTCNGDKNCAKDLKALCILETNCNPERNGDGGKSFGIYQIHRGYHPDITVDQAKDIVWSSKWTLNRLRYYGYDDSARKDIAIMRHNGTPNTTKTLAYLAKFKKIRASL